MVVGGNATTSLFLLRGNGAGGFGAPETLPHGYLVNSLLAGDFNGDGKYDLVASDPYDDRVTVLFGNGNGTFQAAELHRRDRPAGRPGPGRFQRRRRQRPGRRQLR